jgi:hypothetical protein
MTVFVSHERMGAAPCERARCLQDFISPFFGTATSRS